MRAIGAICLGSKRERWRGGRGGSGGMVLEGKEGEVSWCVFVVFLGVGRRGGEEGKGRGNEYLCWSS